VLEVTLTLNPDFAVKTERGANLEQLVLASTRNFTSQIADFIFWNLRFGICDPEGHVFAAEGLLLAHEFCSTAESGINKLDSSSIRCSLCFKKTFMKGLGKWPTI
jgi:hypothetical protein